jgi:tetratricopeptide (TPR) repeat protein
VSKPFFVQALDALTSGDRRGAASLLARQIREGNTSVGNLRSVISLAEHIGETGLAIEASRLSVVPDSIESRLGYWAMLATHGHPEEAAAEIERQPSAIRDNRLVLHFRGTLATQFGRFGEAEDRFRRALVGAPAPAAMRTWFALAMIKRFKADDPDIDSMERLAQDPHAPSDASTCLDYGLGKACEDIGDIDRAFACYARGAARRRQDQPFDGEAYRRTAEAVIAGFSAANLQKLARSGFERQRSLFVTGLPRSGTTLIEQVLRSHPAVADGAELNLFSAAMIPTRGVGIDAAFAYQRRSTGADPWGEIAADYARLVDRRFGSRELVIDKSLGQSLIAGHILHAMPHARIAWLRRDPQDVALSCFSTFFATGLPWTWSLTDIAAFMRIEDRLFEHWRRVFPDRILTVPYEGFVTAPDVWTPRLQRHFGLPVIEGLESAPREGVVGTASAGQVRQPISTTRVGRAKAFERHLEPFSELYFS